MIVKTQFAWWLWVALPLLAFGLSFTFGVVLRQRSPLAHLRKYGVLHSSHKSLKISELEMHYGDKNPKTNPYASARTWKAIAPKIKHIASTFVSHKR